MGTIAVSFIILFGSSYGISSVLLKRILKFMTLVTKKHFKLLLQEYIENNLVGIALVLLLNSLLVIYV